MKTSFLSVRVPGALAQRFTAFARTRGGKSVVVRQMLERELNPSAGAPTSGSTVPRAAAGGAASPVVPAVAAALGPSQKITMRLAKSEMALLGQAAAARGMTRTQWAASLMRARLGRGIPQTADERHALRAVARELHRIGTNVNQIARAVNTDARSGRPVAADVEAIREARAAIDQATSELRMVLGRSAGYWDLAA
jgi:hypothetical protein